MNNTRNIDEVLSKNASAGEWISDFVKSDNPKFAGKSKEKRKQMALAAYYAKQRKTIGESMSTKDLVNAIIAGDAIGIQQAFEVSISEKISDRLDGYRQEIAQSMFATEDVELDEGAEQIDELDQLALRGMYSTDPKSKQHIGVTTNRGKVARAKKNVPDLKSVIKASAGKHPKANLPEEVDLDEGSKHASRAGTEKRPGSVDYAQKTLDRKKEVKTAVEKRRDVKLPEDVQIEQLEVSNVEAAMYALQEGRGVLDTGLDEAVSNDSKGRYEYSNGKKPSGRGNWMFSTVKPSEHDFKKHADQTVSVQGTFSDAAKKAAAHFKEKGHSGEIHVMP